MGQLVTTQVWIVEEEEGDRDEWFLASMTSSLHVWKNSIHPSIHDQTSNGHKSVMSPNQQYPLTDDLHNTDQKILGLGNPFRLNFGMYHIPKHF